MNGLESLWHTLKDKCVDVWEDLRIRLNPAIESFKKKAPEVLEEIKDWGEEVLGFFQKKPAKALDAVRNGDAGALFALNLSNEQLASIRGTRFAQGMTLVHWAAYHGKVKMLDPLIAHGVDPAARTPAGVTAMGVAAIQGHTQVVLELSRLGVDINAEADDQGTAPLEMAYAAKKTACVTALLKAGADGSNILSAISKAKDEVTLARLLAMGLSPNVWDSEGMTPLHQAVRSESLPCVTMLLDASADINAANSMSLLPIDYVSKTSVLREFLLKAGSRRQGTSGWSPETRAKIV